MKYFLFFLCSLLSITAIGQKHKKSISKQKDVDLVINRLVDSLKENKTDYIIVVSRIINGQFPDSIGFPSYRYIYWLKDSVTYYQEFRGYIDHDVIKDKRKLILKSEVFAFLSNNYDSLKDDSILPFIKKYNSKNIECYEVVHNLHSSFNTISIITRNGGVRKEFEDYDLEEGVLPYGINLNSNHNKNSKLKKLWDLLLAVVENGGSQ